METITETEEDSSSITLDVTDSSFTEPSFSSSNAQNYRPQDNSTSTASVPDAKYWEQMYGMLLHRVDPTYFLKENILTEALHDTPTFEVP